MSPLPKFTRVSANQYIKDYFHKHHPSSEINTIVKRGNWAAHEAGVIVVFCVVFIVAGGALGLFIWRKIAARKGARAERINTRDELSEA